MIEQLTGKQIPSFRRYIEMVVSGETVDGIDASMPTLLYLI